MKVLPLFLLSLAAGMAQPMFDVASVKPSPRDPKEDRIMIVLGNARHGAVTLRNTTLSECIRYAYGLSSEDQISGPDWLRDRNIRFDISAKAPPETPNGQILLMTQNLLAERFQLALHREPKNIAHADLVMGGSGPKRSTSQEEGPSTLINVGRGRLNYNHLMMSTLAVLLSRQLKMVVVDRTGLTGYFDIDLRWTPEEAPETDVAPEFPDIYRALPEQLGLKLEKSKAPLEVLVIDHAEKVPAGN